LGLEVERGWMEVLRAILVNLVVPLAGLQIFIWLRNRICASGIEQPQIIILFIIFATYGGWLMVFLTILFWYWSGMALIGLIYLVFVAPIVMTVVAVMLYRQRGLSRYHLSLFIVSSIYPCLVGILAVVRYFHGNL
jgi:hypothetical protein